MTTTVNTTVLQFGHAGEGVETPRVAKVDEAHVGGFNSATPVKAWRPRSAAIVLQDGVWWLQFGHAGEGVETATLDDLLRELKRLLQFGHAGEGVETEPAEGAEDGCRQALQFGHAGEGVETVPVPAVSDAEEGASIRPRR